MTGKQEGTESLQESIERDSAGTDGGPETSSWVMVKAGLHDSASSRPNGIN